jgi:membrane protein implicated in regulation of membrane protease activity
MDIPEALFDPKFLLQLLVVVVTVILSVWRTTTRLQERVAALETGQMRLSDEIVKEIGRLADQVEKQNGYVRTHGEELGALRERTAVTEKLVDALVKRETAREIKP